MENKSKLDIAKQIIDKYYDYAQCGIFNSRNWFGDDTDTIYLSDGLVIDICFYRGYFVVCGLSKDEFLELEKYYNDKELNMDYKRMTKI